jgi:hypothetical protein
MTVTRGGIRSSLRGDAIGHAVEPATDRSELADLAEKDACRSVGLCEFLMRALCFLS